MKIPIKDKIGRINQRPNNANGINANVYNITVL